MSWNKKAFNKLYKREVNEFPCGRLGFWYAWYDENHWCWHDDDEDDSWWYAYYKTPQNMEQYHQMKLMTLLHRIQVKYAKESLMEIDLL